MEAHQPSSHPAPRAWVSISPVPYLLIPNKCLGNTWRQRDGATMSMQKPASPLTLIPMQRQLHKGQGDGPFLVLNPGRRLRQEILSAWRYLAGGCWQSTQEHHPGEGLNKSLLESITPSRSCYCTLHTHSQAFLNYCG